MEFYSRMDLSEGGRSASPERAIWNLTGGRAPLGAQLIIRTPEGFVGGSDHRKEGLVAGF